jgi:hypothetical protein
MIPGLTNTMILASRQIPTPAPLQQAYQFPDLQFAGAVGNPANSLTLNLLDYFTAGQIPVGTLVAVTAKLLPGTGWIYNSPYTWNLTIGTNGFTSFTPYANRKQFFFRLNLTGYNVYANGNYAGDSTESPQGKLTITTIALV